jgi:hypothetical protein
MLMIIQRNYKRISQLKVDSMFRRVLRFLKLFTSSFGILFFIFASHITLATFNYVLISLFGDINIIFLHMWLIFSILFNFVLFGVLIIDFVLNIKFKSRKCFKLWLNTDPFYFRIQHLLLFPLTALVTLFSMFHIYMLNDPNDCTGTVVGIIDMILYFVEEFFFIIYFSGFVLTITYLKKLKSSIISSQPMVDFDEIDDLFNNEYKLDMFRDFCNHEFSTENLLLYEAIKKFQSSNKNQRREIGKEIHTKYLNGNLSELEANIPQVHSVRVKLILESDEEIDSNLFNDILYATKENLSDTYSRFIISESAENYELTAKLFKENAKVSGRFFSLFNSDSID